MISMESAETSNRGDSLSSSDEMAARGETEEGGGNAGGGVDVLDNRLWTAP
jgi:hypothetical protein